MVDISFSVHEKKGDPRFVFLDPEHAFHGYYTQKLLFYSDLHRELQAKQSAENKRETREESPAERAVIDPELMKTERRKKAALFLDQMRRDRVAGIVVILYVNYDGNYSVMFSLFSKVKTQ